MMRPMIRFAAWLALEAQDAEALAVAARARADEIMARVRRLESRVQARRQAILTLMRAAGVSKLERPTATLSRRHGQVRVEIVAPDEVPRQLCRVSYAPDKAAIRRQIEQGEDVPGARLVTGDDTLAIRS